MEQQKSSMENLGLVSSKNNMGQFVIQNLNLLGAKKIKKKKYQDKRGYLSRVFCYDELKKNKINFSIKQINITLTKKKGTIRGLHFQLPPHSEIKMVSCIKGKIFDVIVDLRKNSKTFLKTYSEILSEKNQKSLIVPKGFAHGFQALEDNCEILYFHSENYNSDYEDGIKYNDPQLSIKWPKNTTNISKRDDNFKLILENFKGLKI